ncbi:hypothetical protein ABL364_004880, partial [Escherichia coli]
MNKKFSKTILSSAVAGLLLVSGGAMAANKTVVGKYTIEYMGDDSAKIYETGKSSKNYDGNVLLVNTEKGSIAVVNENEVVSAIGQFKKGSSYETLKQKIPNIDNIIAQEFGEQYRYFINSPSLKKDSLSTIKEDEITKITNYVNEIKSVITSKTASDYQAAIDNGMSHQAALTIAKAGDNAAVLKEFNRLVTNVNALKDTTTFALDENGEITDGQGVETVSVKSVVADVKADTTIYQNKDGSYTLDQSAPGNVRVNDAVVSLDNRTRSNTQAIQ